MKSSCINFGVTLKVSDIDTAIKFARTVEKLGFDSIHLSDHISEPLETLTMLTAIAMGQEQQMQAQREAIVAGLRFAVEGPKREEAGRPKIATYDIREFIY